MDKTRYLVLVCDEDVRIEEMGSPGQYGVGVEGAGQDAARDGHYLTWVWGRVAYIGRWRVRERQESKDTGRGGGEEGEGEGGGRGGGEEGERKGGGRGGGDEGEGEGRRERGRGGGREEGRRERRRG